MISGQDSRQPQPITQLAADIGAARDWPAMCRAVLRFAATVSPANILILSLYDEQTELRRCAYVGRIDGGSIDEPDLTAVPPLPLNDSPQSRAIRTRSMVQTADFPAMSGNVRPVVVFPDLVDNPPGSSVAVPLLVDGEALGVLELQSPVPDAFGCEHIELVQMAASLAAVAAKNMRLAEAAKQGERRYMSLLRNSSDTTLLTDPEGTTLWIGGAVQRDTGFAPWELEGANIFASIHPADRAEAERAFEHALVRGRGPSVTFRFRRKDGSWAWKESIATNLLDDPAVGAVVVNSRDVTERKRAEDAVTHERDLTEAAIRSIPGVFYMIDAQGRFVRWNDNFAELTGLSPVEVAATHPLDVVVERDLIEQKMRDVFELGSATAEAHLLAADGSSVLHTLTGERAMWNGEPHLIGIGIDISSRERSEIQQRRLLTDLSERVKELRLLHRTSQMLQDDHRDVGNLLRALAEEIPRAFQAPDATEARIQLAGIEATTPGFDDAAPSILSCFVTSEGCEGVIEVAVAPSAAAHLEPIFLEEERDLLGAVGQMLLAYLNRRLASEQNLDLTGRLKTQVAHLSALQRIGESITSGSDLDLTLGVILDQVTDVLDADAADILLFDRETQTLEFRAGKGLGAGMARRCSYPLGTGCPGRAALDRAPVLVSDARLTRRPEERVDLDRLGFVGCYTVPLVAKGELHGVMGLFRREPLMPDREWQEFAQSIAVQAALAIQGAKMFEGLQRSNTELQLAYDRTIEGWARALDLKDEDTAGHSQRVTELAVSLARRMGVKGEDLANLRRGALLHDIGKMGVPDRILLKPAKLDPDEWSIMKRHTTNARDLLRGIPFLEQTLDIPYAHHERYDGTGYPLGLAGQDIPLAARIFAVVDVYDALTSNRPYRGAWSRDDTIEYIRVQAGAHFDPLVVDAFLAMLADSVVTSPDESSI